jgi:hypothetical protein
MVCWVSFPIPNLFSGDWGLHGTNFLGGRGCDPVRRRCISWSLVARNGINATNRSLRIVLYNWELWYCEQCAKRGWTRRSSSSMALNQSIERSCCKSNCTGWSICETRRDVSDIDRQLPFTLNHPYLKESDRQCLNFISFLSWLPILDIQLQESSRRPRRQPVLLGRLQQCFLESPLSICLV